jgi:hypothetical protein
MRGSNICCEPSDMVTPVSSLAGDAAHLVIPTGGLGMNTGIGDVTDLAWKQPASRSAPPSPYLLLITDLIDSARVSRRGWGSGCCSDRDGNTPTPTIGRSRVGFTGAS